MFSIVLLAMTLPVALTCKIDDQGRRVAMTLRLDEAHGMVRYAWPATALGRTSRAVFTREAVMFDGFTLDRASLAIMRDGDAVTAALGAEPHTARGRCRADRPRSNPDVRPKPKHPSGNRGM